jgi:hypothetical protein
MFRSKAGARRDFTAAVSRGGELTRRARRELPPTAYAGFVAIIIGQADSRRGARTVGRPAWYDDLFLITWI